MTTKQQQHQLLEEAWNHKINLIMRHKLYLEKSLTASPSAMIMGGGPLPPPTVPTLFTKIPTLKAPIATHFSWMAREIVSREYTPLPMTTAPPALDRVSLLMHLLNRKSLSDLDKLFVGAYIVEESRRIDVEVHTSILRLNDPYGLVDWKADARPGYSISLLYSGADDKRGSRSP